jgi:biotin carboxylase
MNNTLLSADRVHRSRLLFVHSGSSKKRLTFQAARDLNADVHVLNTGPSWADGLASTTYTPKLRPSQIIEFADRFGAENHLDGVVTFWEEDVPTCALIASQLGLPGNSPLAAMRARSKYKMRQALERAGIPGPRYARIRTAADLELAAKYIGFPAVLKPEWGSDSEWVAKVTSLEDADTKYADLNGRVRSQDCIYKYPKPDFILESFLAGPEVSVEGVVQNGHVTIYAVIDKAPMREPDFVELGEITPSRLKPASQRAIIETVIAATHALGLTNSGIHAEVKLTPDGPRIVEVGARMGGDCIHALVRRVYGIDLAAENIRVALGQPVSEPAPSAGFALSSTLVPELSGVVRLSDRTVRSRRGRNLIEVVMTKNPGDVVRLPPDGYDNLAWVSTWGRNYTAAARSLRRYVGQVSSQLHIDPAGDYLTATVDE